MISPKTRKETPRPGFIRGGAEEAMSAGHGDLEGIRYCIKKPSASGASVME